MNLESVCKRPMKLMFAVSLYEINGACAVAKTLIESLDKKKFQIVLMAENIGERYFGFDPDIRIINLDIRPQKGLVKKISNILSHIGKIKNTILSERPDIVLSFGTILNCYILLALSKTQRKDIKVIISEHSEGFLINYRYPGLKGNFTRKICKFMMALLYRRADCIIAVSRNIANHLGKFSKGTNKIKVIYNPVNINGLKKLREEKVTDFNFKEDFSYITVVSRLSPEKGIDYLLRAFAKMTQKTKCKLIIIGDGSHRANLENLAQRLNISVDVTFMGHKENPYKYLKETDMLILPSIYEGFPIIILESYACEVPIIATRCVRSIEEIIADGKDGILVNPLDIDALYAAMDNLMRNKDLRERLKSEGLRTVKKFDISVITREYQDLFLSVKMQNGNYSILN